MTHVQNALRVWAMNDYRAFVSGTYGFVFISIGGYGPRGPREIGSKNHKRSRLGRLWIVVDATSQSVQRAVQLPSTVPLCMRRMNNRWYLLS